MKLGKKFTKLEGSTEYVTFFLFNRKQYETFFVSQLKVKIKIS